MSKHIGSNIRVKFSDDSPLSGTIMSLHIKNLEADTGVSNQQLVSDDKEKQGYFLFIIFIINFLNYFF